MDFVPHAHRDRLREGSAVGSGSAGCVANVTERLGQLVVRVGISRLCRKRVIATTALVSCCLISSADATDSTQWTPPALANQMSSFSPEACNGTPTTNVTICGPSVSSAAVIAQSHAQFVTVQATVGMTSTGSSASNLCSPWGGTVAPITLQVVISGGGVLSVQAGASEPPSYPVFLIWPMSLPFLIPANQGATISLSGGPNGKGCGTFTYSIFAT
jgi:hypothetical protein